MNREQRRAQLKQLGKKFNGLDITKGTLDIPISDSSETLTLDLMNFDTIFYLTEMADKFSNLQEYYKEDFEEVDSIQDKTKKSLALVRLYKKVINDFVFYVDNVFGDGATKKIFGNTAPMPQTIAEFIEDLSPVVQAISSVMSSETENSSVSSILSSSNAVKYSGDRLGNV